MKEQYEAGADLNARIHTEVMGHVVKYAYHVPPGRWEYSASESGTPFSEVPDYSGDIAAAWLVVERMTALNWYSTHTDLTLDSKRGWWAWHFTRYSTPATGGGVVMSAYASTAPLAICRAALAAVEARS